MLKTSNIHTKLTNSESVILLHGMGRTAFSMILMEMYLKKKGYHTINRSYPSTSLTIEEIAQNILPKLISECESSKIHFVTHSLGGIIIRQYLQSNTLPQGSRIVMISPPNQGSEIADKLLKYAWYKKGTGPAGQQLTTADDSVPNTLKPINHPVGVITGRQTLEPWFSRLISGEDDGKVSVKRARLAEMKDFLVVNHAHTFIMNSHLVKKQVVHFLQKEYFFKLEQN